MNLALATLLASITSPLAEFQSSRFIPCGRVELLNFSVSEGTNP